MSLSEDSKFLIRNYSLETREYIDNPFHQKNTLKAGVGSLFFWHWAKNSIITFKHFVIQVPVHSVYGLKKMKTMMDTFQPITGHCREHLLLLVALLCVHVPSAGERLKQRKTTQEENLLFEL